MESVLLGSIMSALSTGVGALPILFMRRASHKFRDILLALSAGIMVAACTFSLIPQALGEGSVWVVAIGVLIGVAALTMLEASIPHVDLLHKKAQDVDEKAMLVVAAITLHNIPEGLSVGVSFGSGVEDLGGLIAFAIGLQNAPEGFLVALFLANQKISRVRAFVIATLTGCVEIVASLAGYALTSVVTTMVPYGLAFAAGAMLFIVYKELIPESHGDGHELSATYAFIAGLLLMLVLLETF